MVGRACFQACRTQSPGRHRGSLDGASRDLAHRTGTRLRHPPVCASIPIHSEYLTRFGCEAVSLDEDSTATALGGDAFLATIKLKNSRLWPGALPLSTYKSDSVSSSCMCSLSEVLRKGPAGHPLFFPPSSGRLPFVLPRPFDTLPCLFLPLGREGDAWGAERYPLWEDWERVKELDFRSWGWGDDWLLPDVPICLHSIHLRCCIALVS